MTRIVVRVLHGYAKAWFTNLIWNGLIWFSGDMDEDPSFRPHHLHQSTEEDAMGEDDVEAISQAKLYSDHHHHHHYHPHQHHQAADR